MAAKQSDWIEKYSPVASSLLPDDRRTGWRTITLKILKAPEGIQMKMRSVNSIGSDHSFAPNGAAQQAARELLALYNGTAWRQIVAVFTQTQNTMDGGKIKISCAITVEPTTPA